MTTTKCPDGGDLEPLCLIDTRLEDLAQANVVLSKSPRLDAMDKIARNAREISWLKDLRSTLLLTRTPASQPPVEGLREALVAAKKFIYGLRDYSDCFDLYEGVNGPKIMSTIDAALASPSLTAGENTKSDAVIPSSNDMDARFAWLEAKAIDMGYMLVPEPPHPDSPHAVSSDPSPTALPGWVENALDRSPATRREILRTGELASQFGWTDTSPTAPDVREALEWVRGEIFALCEATEDSARDGQDFSRGRCLEAKRMRRAMGEVIRERLAALSQQPVAVADREAIARIMCCVGGCQYPDRCLAMKTKAGPVLDAIMTYLLHPQPARGER